MSTAWIGPPGAGHACGVPELLDHPVLKSGTAGSCFGGFPCICTSLPVAMANLSCGVKTAANLHVRGVCHCADSLSRVSKTGFG